MSSDFAPSSRRADSKVGSSNTMATLTVQPTGVRSKAQPATNRSTSAAATKLRRRLSNIFQRDKADKGLRSRRSPCRGTQGISQGNSCQSPRIQRWRRLTSAA